MSDDELDELGTVRWFGRASWGAPMNDPRAQVPTPVGKLCIYCVQPIEADDDGVTTPYTDGKTVGVAAYHLDHFLQALGITDELLREPTRPQVPKQRS